MGAAKIVMGDIQRDRCNVVVQLLAKAVSQAGKATLAHAQQESSFRDAMKSWE
jgi:hypothetical protein